MGADDADQVDDGAGDDTGGVHDLVAGSVQAVVKLARSVSTPGRLSVASAMAVRSSW